MGSAEKVQPFLSVPVDQLLAITAYGEARGEGAEGMAAVLNVIKNRTNFASFKDSEILGLTGSSYHAVILKPYQFSMYNLNDPVRTTAERIAKNFSLEIGSNTTLKTAYDLSIALLNGQLADNSGGATFYHSTSISPSWASTMSLTGQIGNHLFYASSPIGALFSAITEPIQTQFKKDPIPLILMGAAIALSLIIMTRR